MIVVIVVIAVNVIAMIFAYDTDYYFLVLTLLSFFSNSTQANL